MNIIEKYSELSRQETTLIGRILNILVRFPLIIVGTLIAIGSLYGRLGYYIQKGEAVVNDNWITNIRIILAGCGVLILVAIVLCLLSLFVITPLQHLIGYIIYNDSNKYISICNVSNEKTIEVLWIIWCCLSLVPVIYFPISFLWMLVSKEKQIDNKGENK